MQYHMDCEGHHHALHIVQWLVLRLLTHMPMRRTTNHVERLSKALIRPGRVDYR